MPSWGELLAELGKTKQQGVQGEHDVLRRKYLAKLAKKTGRNVIAYTTCWTSQPERGGPIASINPEDVQGFMEVVYGLRGDALDLVLHSPGGSPEATEAIVSYLRQKFKTIRIFIPQAAMSAATMLACAADEVFLAKHSSIGPIDPQMIVRVDGQAVIAPAAAIQEQYQQALREIAADPSRLPAWVPLLRQYGPSLLAQCRYAEDLSKQLVREWLTRWMFNGEADGAQRADKIANDLARHANFNSHSRFINRDAAKAFGLKIRDLEDDQELQDLVLSVFHTATLTYSSTPAAKILENHEGRCFLRLASTQNVMINLQPPPGAAPPGSPPGASPGPAKNPLLAPPSTGPMFPGYQGFPKKKP